MWTQNHVEGLGFLPIPSPLHSGSLDSGHLDIPREPEPRNAYFFLAACSRLPVEGAESFAYIPASGNLLRKRERHIALLNEELEQKTVWLKELEEEHTTLNRTHEKVLAELEEHNVWAARLNQELMRSGDRIVELQDEIEAANSTFQERITALEQEASERLSWVRDLEAQIARARSEIERLNNEATGLREAFEERTRWGESMASGLQEAKNEIARLGAENARLQAIVAAIEASRWVRLGRTVHLGPEIPGDGR
jgi:chromosome segregation ATPase